MASLHTSIPQETLKQVRRIEIRTRRLVNEIFSGQYSSVFKGRGMEFSQAREYQPGDDPKTIDWNVTARTGHLFTKEFSEERELTVMLLIDASRSLFFGSRKNLKSETAAELAALLAFSAIRNNDRVGLLIFTDRVEKYVPPRKGQRNILRLIREILTFEPEGNSTRLDAGLDFLGRVQKRRAVCFLLSDFLCPFNYEKPLRAAARRHDLIAVRLSDPLETRVPVSGRLRLADIETGEPAVLNLGEETRRDMAARADAFFSDWKKTMGRNRVDAIEVTSGEPYVPQLLSFFKSRSKRFR